MSTAIRNGLTLIRGHSVDYALIEDCFRLVVGEVEAHVQIEA